MPASIAASSRPAVRPPVRWDRIVAALNEGRHPNGRITHEATIPFGPAMRVERFRLGNGLGILVLVDGSAPVVSYHTWFSVGSRHERPGKTGLAHLFEHLMFNETEGKPPGSFDRRLEEAGAESNAATWVDWTFYHENVPRESLGLVVRLEAERMAKLLLREKQVTSEKEVVANERRYRVDDDVEGSINETLYATAFEKHAYRWPTIGWMADIEGFTTGDCEAFYRTFYAPNNATLVVVGDVRPRDLLARVQEGYGHLPPAALPVEDVHPEPPQLAEKRVVMKKPTATDKIAIGYQGPAFGDFDHAPLTMLSELLFSGRSSRGHRSLVQKLELATDVRGWVSTFRDPGLFEIYATARPGKAAQELLDAIDRELAQVIAAPPSQDEIDKVKARVELALVQSLETAGGKAEQLGFYGTVLGDPAGAFSRLEAYRRVGASDLLRVARRWLDPARRTIIEVHPEQAAAAEGAS